MIAFPPCKINLGLHVIRKRVDGFHDLETCFFPVGWTDILEIVLADEVSFSCSGNSIPGPLDENLCLKAYNLLQKDFNLPAVKIHLHKIIPTGAGLGGGSSDAAHTLRLLNTIFQLNLSIEKLAAYAAKLGSDCAFFIQDLPMVGTGRGEILSPVNVDLKGKFLMVIKPAIHVSTAEAYARITPKLPERSVAEILDQHPVHEWKNLLVNDFEFSVFKKHPLIKELKKRLYNAGAIYASMSGSGAAVFGIFEKAPALHVAPHEISWVGTIS